MYFIRSKKYWYHAKYSLNLFHDFISAEQRRLRSCISIFFLECLYIYFVLLITLKVKNVPKCSWCSDIRILMYLYNYIYECKIMFQVIWSCGRNLILQCWLLCNFISIELKRDVHCVFVQALCKVAIKFLQILTTTASTCCHWTETFLQKDCLKTKTEVLCNGRFRRAKSSNSASRAVLRRIAQAAHRPPDLELWPWVWKGHAASQEVAVARSCVCVVSVNSYPEQPQLRVSPFSWRHACTWIPRL